MLFFSANLALDSVVNKEFKMSDRNYMKFAKRDILIQTQEFAWLSPLTPWELFGMALRLAFWFFVIAIGFRNFKFKPLPDPSKKD